MKFFVATLFPTPSLAQSRRLIALAHSLAINCSCKSRLGRRCLTTGQFPGAPPHSQGAWISRTKRVIVSMGMDTSSSPPSPTAVLRIDDHGASNVSLAWTAYVTPGSSSQQYAQIELGNASG